jgi:hypothetical protein
MPLASSQGCGTCRPLATVHAAFKSPSSSDANRLQERICVAMKITPPCISNLLVCTIVGPSRSDAVQTPIGAALVQVDTLKGWKKFHELRCDAPTWYRT